MVERSCSVLIINSMPIQLPDHDSTVTELKETTLNQ